MNIRFLVLILTIGTFSQMAAQSPGMTSALYAKRLLTNYYLNSSEYSPLDFQNYRGGFELAYGQNIGKSANIVFPFKTTVFRRPDETTNDRYISFGGRLHLHYKLGSAFSPYLLGGAGVLILPGQKGDGQIPLGAGVNIRINKNLGINLQSEYSISIDGNGNHYQHGLGLYFTFGGDTTNTIIELPPIDTVLADRDGDSIVDSLDNCPDIAGLAAFSGCPDSDNDGISDQTDACPDLPGLLEFNGCPDTDGDGFSDVDDLCPDDPGTENGCPPTDTDGDGVADTEDECPNVKGSLRGCPDRDSDGTKDSDDRCPDAAGPINAAGCPDSDNDGLDDYTDKCPNKAGSLANAGCPEIAAEDKATLEFAMQAVNFNSGSAILTAQSYAILDQIADILRRYPNYGLSINGYTDSVGDAVQNQSLSQRRAESCRTHLVNKGINSTRMSAYGFGEDSPRATNDTPDGRRLNRRVEFDMKLR